MLVGTIRLCLREQQLRDKLQLLRRELEEVGQEPYYDVDRLVRQGEGQDAAHQTGKTARPYIECTTSEEGDTAVI